MSMEVEVILISKENDLCIVSYQTVHYIVSWYELTHVSGDVYKIPRRNLNSARIQLPDDLERE